MRAMKSVVAGAAFALVATFGGGASGMRQSTEPPSSEPTTTTTTTTTVAPTTTTSVTATTTTPPTTVASTTVPITEAPTTPPASPLDVMLEAAADCYFGIPVVRAEVTALRDINGGQIHLEVEQGVVTAEFAVVPPMNAGETQTFLIPERSGRSVTAILLGDLNSRAGVSVNVPSMGGCPPPEGSPTVTAAVERCAGDVAGGALAVTMTNPPGGPERDMAFGITWEDDTQSPVDFRSWNSLPNGIVGPADGEQVSVIVDELEGEQGSGGLPPGEHLVNYGWNVDMPDGSSQYYYDQFAITLPACEPAGTEEVGPVAVQVRMATFNVSLSRAVEGGLVADLSTSDDPQAAAVAEIIQRVRPDVLLVNEFDFDADGEALEGFRSNYLEVGHNGAEPIEYPYWFSAPVNTGVPSGFDLDRDGTVGGPGDAFGFGEFPGQYGMVVLSRYPILTDGLRTFQNLLWTAMPDARLPDNPTTPEPGDWYTADELAVLPLSSKSHWDVPIDLDGTVFHLLASHPTPPSFDGDEDRNGLRNADEIRFWADYVAGADTSWIVDDSGVTGGLAADAEFVIAGDLNADPVDGDSLDGAIQQLLELDVVQDPEPTSDGATEAAELQAAANSTHLGDAAVDTADFADDPAPGNLRVDYVLASDGFDIADAAVFWPTSDDPLDTLVAGDPPTSSDHHLVWVDLSLATPTPATTTTSATTTGPTVEPPTSTPAGYGFDNFFDIPQLGDEAVRGTGCGGDGSIGEVIPDGYWRGYVRSWDADTLEHSATLQFDLICIYLNPVGDQQYLDGWLINNNDRTRSVPIAPEFFAHGTTFAGDEVYTPLDQPDIPFEPNRQVWLRIVNGAAVWAVSSPTPD